MVGSLEAKVIRFEGNEARLNTLVNGDVDETWFTSGGVELPTVRKLFADTEALYDNAILVPSYADMVSQLPNLPDGIVEVQRDETHGGGRTRYKVSEGEAQFLVNTDALADLVNRSPLIYPTFQEASDAAHSLPMRQAVEVLVDEGRNDHRTRYFVESGGLVFQSDLDSIRDDLKAADGADLVGGTVRILGDIDDLRAYTGTSTASISKEGVAGEFTYDISDETSEDDGVFVVVSSDGKRRKRVVNGMPLASWWGLPKVGNCYPELVKIEQYQHATGASVYFENGTYEVIGSLNLPWRNTGVSEYKNYKGAKIVCEGPGVIFKTNSPDGGDVFQLNCVANLSIVGFPTLTGVLTGTDDAGSNGVSVTNGGFNIYAEFEAKDLPHTVKSEYLDGGKAATIQTGILTVLPTVNVQLKCRKAIGCAYGYEVSIDETQLASGAYMFGNKIDIFADGCYRGVTVVGSEPNVVVPSNGLDFGMQIKATLKDCQQYYLAQRDWRISADIHVIQTKAPVNLTPNDTRTVVVSSLGSKFADVKVSGSVFSPDVLYEIGGTTFNYASSQVFGTSDKSTYSLSVSFQTAGTQFELVDTGGNSATNCDAAIQNVGLTSSLIKWSGLSNNLTLGVGKFNKDLVCVNTLSVVDNTGAKKFGVRADGNFQTPLTTSSPIGATYAGKIAVYDPVSGGLLGYFPLYS